MGKTLVLSLSELTAYSGDLGSHDRAELCLSMVEITEIACDVRCVERMIWVDKTDDLSR